MNKPKTIGILGLGNLLLSDEGFGVHFINYLTERYDIPDHFSVLDGGTAGIMLAPFMEGVDLLFVIDTVSLQAEPGSIHCFTDRDVQTGNLQFRMSPHQIGLLDILAICKMRGKVPATEMITVVPEDLSLKIGLSPSLEPKLAEVLEILLKSLAAHNEFLSLKESFAGA
ncbi:MAG: HyaD/HybD family hydrogenase maturation endopeptidase [Desulfobulbaceae bacterium]|nr:HyaD/HybD family hydrogenase maturation endopeptidase [Desulfobulbaceae bacterium]